MYGYSLSSSIRSRATVRSLISLFGAKPVSLLRCYGGFGQLSAAPRLEEAKPFSTDTARVAHGSVKSICGGSHSCEKCARGGFAGISGPSFGLMNARKSFSAPYALSFRSCIFSLSGNNTDTGRNSRSMNFVRGIIEEDGKDFMGGPLHSRYNVEQNADIVHIKLLRNNTFVTVTDSKGNTKCKASAGCVPEMKGGAKLSRYAAEATSEHVGRMSRSMGLKSVVMKVNGFTYFKKKRQAIMSWREGFTNSRADKNPIVFVEDTTRRPHNGCRLPKKRRI
ncbi:hypothetical protein FH972_016168 [Carpinus fangiana]|uniref:Ribosomal protein S11 n=1 Tax=Carpinus fangiana TaxID=176857 RepID=A0A5N6RHT7_9ROSI|nr:hypothetical protein FH972_016168 [Carpinus fangiana]